MSTQEPPVSTQTAIGATDTTPVDPTGQGQPDETVDQIRAIVAGLPGFSGPDVDCSWLSGGGAHKNFLVSSGDSRAVIKLWNCMWEGVAVLPPAPIVFHNTRVAGEAGIGAPVLSVTSDPLTLMVEFLPGAVMQPGSDRWIPRLASKTRQLHDSGIRFANDYNPFAESRKMLTVARHRGVELPADIADLASGVDRVERVLDLRVNEFVPCHNDLYGANILDNGSDLRLIDYDLSGMGDRSYDLGFASTYFELDVDQVNQLCEAYFGQADPRDVARTLLFRVAANWTSLGLWLVALSMADTNDDYDYQGELDSSLRRLRAGLSADDFGSLLQQARR
jgi:hypothetical protein